MTNSDLNHYILHYLTEDKTKSAIMLTGGWGTGKSYYVKNELIPYLSDASHGAHSCIVVSLYGIKDTLEISKSIYLEAKLKFLNAGGAVLAHGKFAAKSVFKGITSFFGVDLSKSEDELKELYESIDLSGRLIILEDIERSEIDILKVLGYVNSLVEQDGAKVLMVANENEILQYHDSEPGKDGKTHKVPDEKTELYLRSKEKTISDTINFYGDLDKAVKEIMLSFSNTLLLSLASDEVINDVIDLMNLKSNNLRAFIYACQKVADIFDLVEIHDEDFLKTVFFSVINLSMNIKDGYFPKWEGNDLVSSDLGIANYPLYRFCYDYIRWQEFEQEKVQQAIDAHKKMRLYDRHAGANGDKDLNILFSYHTHCESDVKTALSHIETRLANSEDIPFYSYGRLAYYLVVCNEVLEFDYSSCKDRMISNLQSREDEIDLDLLFLDHFESGNEPFDQKKKYEEFSKAIKNAIETTRNNFEFTYLPEDISKFYTYVARNRGQIIAGHAFISRLDLEKLLEMVFICSPSQLDEMRGVFWAIYRHAAKDFFIEDDVLFMKSLVSKIESVLPERSGGMDRIALWQIKILIDNLQHFIEQLS